ncbi:MAG: Na+/H+ antiporter [Chitinophagaceae bacterium]|nr:MAG: Na+/H+ antiporter [Chitinophagaceae bacterium]
MHTILPFLLAMIVAIVLVEMWATKLKIAYPVLLVVAGLLVSFIPGLPKLELDPNLIFFIFLPPLLFEACWSVSFKEMRKWWRMIGSFAFLVVFLTALLVAVIANHIIPGFSIALGCLLGGIVAPPDAVSTAAITRFVKVPKFTSAILEGESLLNDASALIIFKFALIAVGSGQFIWQEASLNFVWIVIGGVAVGLALAWLFVQAHRRLKIDAASNIALTIVEPYFMYWLAETLHCSGVLAVVAGGLYMSAKRLIFLDSSSRIQAYNVWECFVFVLNGIVFLVIGLDLPQIVDGLREQNIPLRTAIGYGVMITVGIVVIRLFCAYIAVLATMIFRPNVINRNRSRRQMLFGPFVMGWAGMRGVVSLAAALSIPVALEDGSPFPHRDLILFITFIVILITLLLQGLTLPWIIRSTGAFRDIVEREAAADYQKKVQHSLKQHSFEFLQNRLKTVEEGNESITAWLKYWDEKSKVSGDENLRQRSKAIFIELLESQRQHLVELNKDADLDEEIIRAQLYQIDLREEQMKAM